MKDNNNLENEIRDALGLEARWHWADNDAFQAEAGHDEVRPAAGGQRKQRHRSRGILAATAAALFITLAGAALILNALGFFKGQPDGGVDSTDIAMIRITEDAPVHSKALARPQATGYSRDTEGALATEEAAGSEGFATSKEENSTASASPDADRGRFQGKFYDTSLNRTLKSAFVSDGLVLNFESPGNINMPGEKVILFDLAAQSEQEIPIAAAMPVLRGNFVYYVSPVGYKEERFTLRRYDLTDGSDDVFYTAKEGNLSVGLSLEGKYLSWYEYIFDASEFGAYPKSEADLRAGEGSTGYTCRTVVFDLDENKIVYTNDDMVIDARSDQPYVFADGLIALIEKKDKLKLRLYDFVGGRTVYEQELSELLRWVDYSQGKVAVVNWNGELTAADVADPGTVLFRTSDSLLRTALLLGGHYLAFNDAHNNYIVDLQTGRCVYDSSEDAELTALGGAERFSFGRIAIDRASGLLVSYAEDRREQRERLFALRLQQPE